MDDAKVQVNVRLTINCSCFTSTYKFIECSKLIMLRITNRDYVLTRTLLCDINISIHLCYTHSSVCGSLVVHVHVCTMWRYKLLHLSTILFTPPFITAPCHTNNRMRKIMALNYGRWSGKSTLTFRLIQNSFEQTFPLSLFTSCTMDTQCIFVTSMCCPHER